MADDDRQHASLRFLVRRGGGGARADTLALTGVAGGTLRLAPLDPDAPAAATDGAALAAAGASGWELATLDPAQAPEGVGQWEMAHELARALDPAGGAVVEPDLRQGTPLPAPEAAEGMGAAPRREEAWHLEAAFSGLRAARDAVDEAAQAQVTVVHLDTGYDPGHVLAPKIVARELERNFEDRDPARARSAVEPLRSDALLRNRGHGTGTLGILAGAARVHGTAPGDAVVLGGAPGVRVVPVRVADFVGQFWSSSIAAGLNHARAIGADVVTISLGGLPSSAWADAVNACYEAGIVVVAAAGNNFSGFPTRELVWPARFRRVIGVCGMMRGGRPYVDLGGRMEGNYGPPSAMATAMAAFTPGIPWAVIGTGNGVDADGGGTSAATPQVAATAALWIAANRDRLRGLAAGWQRVEAVRAALFATAHQDTANAAFLGRGVLRAAEALRMAVPDPAALRMEERDSAVFAFLRALSGMGVAPGPREAMFRLEATQIATRSAALHQLLPDMEAATPADPRRIAEALLDGETMSRDLRQWLSGLSGRRFVPAAGIAAAVAAPPARAPRHLIPARDVPRVRRLRVFATDPLQALELRRFDLATATLEIPWDATLRPGPVGEQVEVVDVDPQAGRFHLPVDLADANLLAQDGLAPSLDDPRFHQQMTYAVAMRVVDRFERALGRPVLWPARPDYWRDPDEAPTTPPETPAPAPLRVEDLTFVQRARLEGGFVRRLRIYPHAMQARNAYYSPRKVALLFGYFRGLRPMPDNLPARAGDMVFTCLSFDIVAHETTHAVLDGINRRLREDTNPDVLAFHEALADIVALFERFSLMDLLRREVAEAKGRLGASRLGELAREFGTAMGYGRALRDAIGQDPRTANYMTATEAHDRGAVLVAAVFDAFLSIYGRRTAPLTALLPLPRGERPIHPTAVELLANEARKAAEHVLTMCLRALDYMPPVDIRFSDFLRALITADMEVEAEDSHGYRVAFIEAFRRRCIFAEGVNATSVEGLRWRAPDEQIEGFSDLIRSLDLRWDPGADRLEVHVASRLAAARLHGWIAGLDPQKAATLGIVPGEPFEVGAVRTIQRVTPAGRIRRDVVIVLCQTRRIAGAGGGLPFRSGATIIVSADDDSRDPIRYIVSKSPDSPARQQQARAYLAPVEDGRALYLHAQEAARDEPFALLHRHG